MFEEVLDRAQKGDFGSNVEGILRAAIQQVYDGINSRFLPGRSPVERLSLGSFLSGFGARGPEEMGFIFTLNQDVFLERMFGFGDARALVQRPGVPQKGMNPATIGFPIQSQLDQTGSVHVLVPELTKPRIEPWPALRGSTSYVKLHGSWDWTPDTENRHMVQGGGKAETIGRSPLLSYYFEIFRSYLFSGGKELTVIGYGFRDAHVNELLREAVTEHGLKVAIWDLRRPSDMRCHLRDTANCAVIWDALIDYNQANLSDTFGREARDDTGVYGLSVNSMLTESFLRPSSTWDWPRTG